MVQIDIAKNSKTWSEIVGMSPYSVLHHMYELNALRKNALPLVIREKNHFFVFPLRIMKLLKSFQLVSSPIHFHASIISDTESSVGLIPKALDRVVDFLHEMKVDYLSTCAPTFLSKRYADLLNSWFKNHGASVQVIYAHMISTRNMTFDEIWADQFDKRARNRIRKAEREGVSVIKIGTTDGILRWMDDIHRCNVSALERQGRVGAYPDAYKGVFLSELVSTKKLLKEYFNVYGAIYRGRLIAYMVIQEYNKLLMVSKAMSHSKFLIKGPNEALICYMVRKACKEGFNWFQYGWDRVKMNGKTPSLNYSLVRFKSKFGFEEVPIFIYRLGLTRAGRLIQDSYNFREYLIIKSASIPESMRSLLLRLYVPRRRDVLILSHV